MDGIQKKVDESWKQSVEKEKSVHPDLQSAPETASEKPNIPSNKAFSYLISTLSMQALAALGEMPGAPEEPAGEADLDQAKYLIDTLEMLEQKTRGNLSAQEAVLIQNALYELRVKFVQKTQQ